MPRRAEARGIDELLHPLLVAKRHRLRHRQPGQVKLLAQPRGKHHVGLPQALHPVDAHPASQLAHGRRDRLAGSQGPDRDVVRERVPRDGRNGHHRLVAHADDGRSGGRETAREERHLGRVTRGDHEDIHRGQPSSTRTLVTRCRIASVTTAVSGWRRMT